jgi:hypothetical protein
VFTVWGRYLVSNLHQEILWLLVHNETSYAKPMNSEQLGRLLHVTSAYVRSQLSCLVKENLVGVRRGNGGGYYMMRERGIAMTIPKKNSLQIDKLASVLVEMDGYLRNIERVYPTLQLDFQSEQWADTLEKLIKVMEGLDYCKKMFDSAVRSLRLDAAEDLCNGISITVFSDKLCNLFKQIDVAAENGDYSLLTDLAEYDMLPVIQEAIQLLTVLKARCNGQKGLELVQ